MSGHLHAPATLSPAIDFSGQTEYGTAWASKQQNMYTEMQFVKIRVIFRYAELI